MNKQEGRLALMYVRDRAGVAPHILVVLIVSSEQDAGERRQPSDVDRSKQIDHTGNITGPIELPSTTKHLFAAVVPHHVNEIPPSRFAHHGYFVWRITVIVSVRLQP